MRAMNPRIGWVLAALALGVGYLAYGWQGLVLGITLIVFWLLLQFSRAMRVMRQAGSAPVGEVKSAVMFNAKLRQGMTLMEVIGLTKSLGRKEEPASGAAGDEERYAWADAGQVRVHLHFKAGRLQDWQLERPPEP